MSIDVPDLDDREFEELFEEAKRKIPIYSDEWTDHNAHDTGIAILEMLAWVSETYTYQLDQIRDGHRKKHLQLLGLSRRPPQPATTKLSVEPPDGADGETIPEGERLVVDDRSGDVKRFETVSDTTLVGATLDRVITRAGGDSVNNTTENEADETHFYAFGDDPRADDTLYLGFDGDPFASADHLELAVDLHDADLPDPATHGDRESTFDPSVEVTWQYCTHYPDWEYDEAWGDVPVVEDETNAFYREGTVTLAEPAGWATEDVDSVAVQNQAPGLVWLRCKLETPGYEIPPRFDSIRLNVLDISHRRTIENQRLSTADDTLETSIESNQEFFFRHSPVLEADITVDGQQWTEVADLDASGPTDRHYVLDNQRGSITFGNGIDGAKPPVGEHVVAERYVHGGGTDGNVAETDQWRFTREEEFAAGVEYTDLPVAPMGAATGGTDMESVADALDRFKRDLKRPYRATTLDDYCYVATHTPGLRFGRAHATSTQKETLQGFEQTEIQVVVVPYSTHAKPKPSDGFLHAVREHLHRNRLVTAEVDVQEPSYVDVAVDVAVSSVPGYADEDVIRTVTSELAEYVHPLTGFEGDGWPFGRPLYVTGVTDVVASLPGVRSVSEVALSARGEEEIDDYGNVIIADTDLLSLSEDDVEVTLTGTHGGASP